MYILSTKKATFLTMRGRFRKVLVLASIFGSVIIICGYMKNTEVMTENCAVSFTDRTSLSYLNRNSSKRLLVDTEGCKILDVDPFDEKLKVFYNKLKPYTFPMHPFTNLVIVEDDKIRVNNGLKEQILTYYNIFISEMLYCCVSYLKRYSVEKNHDTVRFREPCTIFYDSAVIEDEYMKIDCYIGTQLIYEKFEFKVLRKPDVETRCKNILFNAQHRGNPCEDQLSVMVLGIDSISRLNFHRQLPKTRKVITEDLNGVELLGYNKAGEYTFATMMPFLTGMNMFDLEKNCKGGAKYPFDDCTFLWDIFGAAGYRTAFIEDMNQYGLLTHQKMGIHRQPADYYGRPFLNAHEMGKQTNVYRLWRNVSNDEAVIQWATEFHEKFVDDLHFGYFWISDFSHNDINTAQHIDLFLPKYLKSFKEKKLLNNTLLILMSDHGMRFGKLRETDIGRFEAKLPFAYFVVPEWYQAKYEMNMKNLRRNAANRFISTFDMHKTLKDMAQCNMPRNNNPLIRNGINMFANISPLRTCKDAGIDDSFCSCQRREFPLSSDSVIAKNVSRIVYEHVRDIAAKRPDICASLELKNVTMIKAETQLETSDVSDNNQDIIYTVTIITKPGDGLFEGTVTYSGNTKEYEVNKNVRRINRYGTTSSCVTDDPLLKPICYCLIQRS